jgi:hypothetical protein
VIARVRVLVVVRGLGWVLAFAAPVVGRAWLEAHAELEHADEAAAVGDADAEIEHLGRALRWRLPLSSHDEVVLDRLFAIGEAAEDSDDDATALAAYREARGGLLATRVLAVPHADARAELDARIARLMAAQERRFATDDGSDREAHHLALLQETPGPDPWRATFAASVLVAWVLTSLAVLARGIDGNGRVRPRPGVLWGMTSLACLVTWMIAWRYAG